jgi:hypothetical protein
MATSLEHYQVAERALDEVVSGIYPTSEQMGFALAKAQVHATLAMAAATALNIGEGGEDYERWRRHASVEREFLEAPDA